MHIKQIRVVVFYTVIMQFFIFPKNYLTSPWKIRPSHNTILPQKFKFFYHSQQTFSQNFQSSPRAFTP